MSARISVLRRASLLAREELKWNRKSYLWAGAIALVAGFTATGLSTDVFGSDSPAYAATSASILDFIFLAGLPILARSAGAWTSKGRASLSLDKHWSFLKRMPLTAQELILGRIFTIALTVAFVTVPLLSLPYFLSSAFSAQFTSPGYLLFATFWVGYLLFIEGVGLFTELGLGGKKGFFVYMALLFPLGGLVGYSNGVQISLIAEFIELLQRNGAVPAVSFFVFGAALLSISGWATIRRFERREI